jgi:hypothetical protein
MSTSENQPYTMDQRAKKKLMTRGSLSLSVLITKSKQVSHRHHAGRMSKYNIITRQLLATFVRSGKQTYNTTQLSHKGLFQG